MSDVVKQSLLPDEHMHGELVTAVCELMKTTLGLLPVPRGGGGDGGGGGVARAADHAIGSAIGAAARALVAVCAAEEARGRRSGVTNFCVMNAARDCARGSARHRRCSGWLQRAPRALRQRNCRRPC